MGAISSWGKPSAEGPAAQVDKTNGPNNGRITFDLLNWKIFRHRMENARAGIEQTGEWLTVWIDLPTTDGQYVVNFYIYSGRQFPTLEMASWE